MTGLAGGPPRPGTVYLVGAGPGDPGLVTVRALELVRGAEVLAYDRLIPPGLVELAPGGCELAYVGKRRDRHALPQAEINALLVDRALAGRRVVRLKGGDPFVFGRGGEEAEACAAAGVPFEVVPGVSAAIAAPAYAGIPVTHRELTSSFAVVTGHEPRDLRVVPWAGLAGVGTLCVLMGVEHLGEIAAELLAAGRDAATPAALVEWGATPAQRVVSATLGTIAAEAARAGAHPPAVIVVGEVVALRERLAWYERRPLFGRTVLVPRTREQAGSLAELLRERGAEPLEVPTIALRPPESWAELDAAVARLAGGAYAWVVVTSRNGADALRGRVEAAGLDARALAGARLAAVGPATAAALAAWGLRADLVPATATAAALAMAFPEGDGGHALLARGDLADTVLVQALAAKGWLPDDVVAYRTVALDELPGAARKRLDAGEVGWLAFTSASTVEGFTRAWGGPPPAGTRVAVIGPRTAEAARAAGLRVDAEAAEHTIGGLVAAIERGEGAAGQPRA